MTVWSESLQASGVRSVRTWKREAWMSGSISEVFEDAKTLNGSLFPAGGPCTGPCLVS